MSGKTRKEKAPNIEPARLVLPDDAQVAAPRNGGFAASISDLSILSVETIGGLRVVEEAVATRLIKALAIVLVRHAEWRSAHAEYGVPPKQSAEWRTAKNRANKAGHRYRTARNMAMQAIADISGVSVSINTTIPP